MSEASIRWEVVVVEVVVETVVVVVVAFSLAVGYSLSTSPLPRPDLLYNADKVALS